MLAPPTFPTDVQRVESDMTMSRPFSCCKLHHRPTAHTNQMSSNAAKNLKARLNRQANQTTGEIRMLIQRLAELKSQAVVIKRLSRLTKQHAGSPSSERNETPSERAETPPERSERVETSAHRLRYCKPGQRFETPAQIIL